MIQREIERRQQKLEMKDKVLRDKDLTQQILKEVHSLRAHNVQQNREREAEKIKKKQEELALKLQI